MVQGQAKSCYSFVSYDRTTEYLVLFQVSIINSHRPTLITWDIIYCHVFHCMTTIMLPWY